MSPRVRRDERPFDPDEELPEPPRPAGRVLDARLHLLDRQVVDVDDVPVMTLDDLELTEPVVGTDVTVQGLLSGPVLATRIFGGRPPRSRLHRTPWRLVAEVGTTVRLGVRGEGLDVLWVERWLRDRVIGRIPGGRHAPE
ncbi:hypothetical protein [Cellulomonas sp. HZM]|uniref:hypothetical protein n=1 Tax=Cellulomonas sp. HZM TaxID=1454010 RepID=UPI000690EB84|nr:hypothetical protein [Cellulomonas sp. HZM]